MMLNAYKTCAQNEQFYEMISPELRDWHIDKAPEILSEATKLADEHTAVRNCKNTR